MNTIYDTNISNHQKIALTYGAQQELIVKPIIAKVFNLKLHKTKFKLSKFDFYDTQHQFLIELKCYRYSYNKYNTEVIGIGKALNQNSVFVFQHEEDNNIKDLYYIQYDKPLFDTFNKRAIYTPERGTSEICFDIPKIYLTKISKYNIYHLHYNLLDRESNDNYILNDMLNYNNYNSKIRQLTENNNVM